MRRGAGTALALGVVAGAVSGIAGVGGGIVMVPVLALLLGFPQHRAHGTSLAIMVFPAFIGALQYALKGHVDAQLAVQFAVGGVVGAMVGPWLASLVKAKTLKRLFGLLLMLVAVRLFMTVWFGSLAGVGALAAGGPVGLLIESGVGLAAGVVAGFFGVGGGIVMVPAIVLLLGRLQVDAQGVSLCVIVPVSAVAALVHRGRGNVDGATAKYMVPATIVGNVVGAQVAVGPAAEPILRTVFSALLAATGYLMLRRREDGNARS